MSEQDRQRFEEDYLGWLRTVAKDAAWILADMPEQKRRRAVEGYKKLLDPRLVFRKPVDTVRIKRLAGNNISKFILLETEAVAFFPSIYSSVPGALDFSLAMNRRFFYRDLWFPIISLDSEYIKQSSDRNLGFTLDHEFEMSRIYEQISSSLRTLSSDEKRDVSNSALKRASEVRQITKDEPMEDERLMIRLSKTEPLIPKPYAETALTVFLEENFSDVRSYGIPSKNENERTFGDALYAEFLGWADFSKKTYASFVGDLLVGLNEANLGYA